MQKKAIRAASLALAALLAAGPAASASVALGTEVHDGTTYLAQGVEYTHRHLWSATYSDLRTEHYLEYTPNELVQPAVSYGSSVIARSSLTNLAKALEEQGKRVLGGINGDYFVMATGEPLGIVITDGVLRSSSSTFYALGFDAEGKAFIGQPYLSITAAFRENVFPIAGGLNKIRDEGYVLYSSDYYPNTYHSVPGIDVILTPSTENLGEPAAESLVYTDVPVIGGRLSCTVEEVLLSDASIDIPEGKLVLSVNYDNDEWLTGELAALQPGDTVEIDISSWDPRWQDAVTAIGGLYKMVTDGVAESGLETAQAPRTAVGVRPDGSTIFYTIDGRQSGYSVGASMVQVANRLIELGCVEAICLDGGGSTTLGATLPAADGFSLINSPSEGVQRSVTNALFLVADQAEPGPAQSLILSPGDAMLLPGAKLALSGLSVDALGQTVEVYTESELEFDPTPAGEIQDGIFTAGTQAGAFTVTASAGGLTGEARFTVAPTPDRITVRREDSGAAVSSLSLAPGETVGLTAGAVYRNLPLLGSDDNFTWSVTSGLGTIEPDGTLTAGSLGGSGTVTVTAGSRTVSIPLTVAAHVLPVEDFEGPFNHTVDSPAARIEPENTPAYVRFGSQSARITYDTAGTEYAAVGIPLRFQDGERYLSLWVYGDGSGNTLTAPIRSADGESDDLILAVLNFTGWQQIVTPLPHGAAEALTLKVTPTGSAAAGVIWLDQITTANQYLIDTAPPAVTVTLTEDQISAALADDVDASFEEAQISVTYDGQPLDFTLAGSTVTAVLPANDGSAHRVTVTAVDASGNIGRGSADLAADGQREEPFLDMETHWAREYVNYLYDQKISNGIEVEGGFQFQPNKNITRGEFALMAAHWLRLDLTQYSDVELPFADLANIPSWCLDGIKAMYAMGVMQGSAGDGGTYAYAGQSITRAEAMTLLGRIQPKGYAAADLTFTDAGDVPAWAADYVGTMVAQGIVNGYADNTIAPNSSITRGEIAKVLYTMR